MSSRIQRYDHRAIEARWQPQWDQWAIHRWDPARPRNETFVVDSPPPTVSGELHIGHVFSYTHQDLIVRYQRMRGRNIAYPMGWDDNGLPTERRVQNTLRIRCEPSLPYDPAWEPTRSQKPPGALRSVSRQNFIEACGRITREDEAVFEALWRHVGLSVDWQEKYATIDEHCRRLAQLSFLDLLAKGFAYRAEAPTMWDVDFRSAVAQAEAEDRPGTGFFFDLAFCVEDGPAFTVGTTRPELLPACIAVVAHPEDARYQDLLGRHAITPLFRARVPLLASEHADPEKGTGIMMICTFGDAADVAWWRASGLPARDVLDEGGRLKAVRWGQGPFASTDPKAAQRAQNTLAGLATKSARARMVELLREPRTSANTATPALRSSPRKVEQTIKYYEKGERPLEYLTRRQWFVRLLEHRDVLLEQGRKIQWHPPHFRSRYEHWVQGLNQDWCISRQRFFGVPFPVWYPLDDDGGVDGSRLILPAKLPVDPMAEAAPGFQEEQRGQPGGFLGDPDVMDTWATSSLTPQIASHWRLDPIRHGRRFPADIRPQSHEIIRTWAFYTIAKAWMHEGTIPWRHVLISGWVLDRDRKKMSKTRGIAITPERVLDEHSADAVRYWAARARLGADTAFDPKVLGIGRRLAVKIFNACRFVIDRLQSTGTPGGPRAATEPLDRAFLTTLAATIEESTADFERFDYAAALAITESAFWSFCSGYLELVKNRAYGSEDAAPRRSALAALALGLRAFLRLFAPFLPFVTEEAWSWFFAGCGASASIHTAPWPTRAELGEGAKGGKPASLVAATEILAAVRGEKTRARLSLRSPVERLEIVGQKEDLCLLPPVLADLAAATATEVDAIALRPTRGAADARYDVRLTLGEES